MLSHKLMTELFCVIKKMSLPVAYSTITSLEVHGTMNILIQCLILKNFLNFVAEYRNIQNM